MHFTLFQYGSTGKAILEFNIDTEIAFQYYLDAS